MVRRIVGYIDVERSQSRAASAAELRRTSTIPLQALRPAPANEADEVPHLALLSHLDKLTLLSMNHPLSALDARKCAKEIVENGTVSFTQHAQRELRKDDLDSTDCLNLLRAGVFSAPELENGEWRYRTETQRMCVIFTFPSESRIRVITAWRKQR
jgi:hypothetical protein